MTVHPVNMYSIFTGSSTVRTAKYPLYSESTTTIDYSKSISPHSDAGSHVSGETARSHMTFNLSCAAFYQSFLHIILWNNIFPVCIHLSLSAQKVTFQEIFLRTSLSYSYF